MTDEQINAELHKVGFVTGLIGNHLREAYRLGLEAGKAQERARWQLTMQEITGKIVSEYAAKKISARAIEQEG